MSDSLHECWRRQTAYRNAAEDNAHIYCVRAPLGTASTAAQLLTLWKQANLAQQKMWVASRMSRDTKFLGHPDDLGLE